GIARLPRPFPSAFGHIGQRRRFGQRKLPFVRDIVECLQGDANRFVRPGFFSQGFHSASQAMEFIWSYIIGHVNQVKPVVECWSCASGTDSEDRRFPATKEG